MPLRELEITDRELANLCRHFAALLDADVDLLRILKVLRRQNQNPHLKEILATLEKDSRLGKLLSESLVRYPMVFSPFFLSMVRQGEEQDVLDQVMLKLAEQLEREGDRTFGSPRAEQIALRPGLDLAIEKLRPLMVWMSVSLAVIALAIAGLWYATNADWVSRDMLGPNVLLLVGILVFAMTLIFLRYRPPEVAWCSFCGRGEQQARALLPGQGVWICDGCLERNVQILKEQRETEKAEAPEESEEEEEEIISHDIRVIREEDLEE